MNEPMTDERLDELVGMVEREDWFGLHSLWDDAGPPFGFLGGGECGCPSQVRHNPLIFADLSAVDLANLKTDPLIVDMTKSDLGTLLSDHPREIFQRFEHYQRLVQS